MASAILKRARAPGTAKRLESLGERWGLAGSSLGRYERLLELLADDPHSPTAVKDPRRAVDLHLADSLSALGLDALSTFDRVADIGSGAGFPGLVLAIAMPDTGFDLVESSSRKCAFLERAVATLELENAHVVCSRVEELATGGGAGAYDGALARAVGPLATLVEYAAPLLRLGGLLIAWKGRRDPEEERQGSEAAAILGLRPLGVERVHPFAGSRNRHIYTYEKLSPCRPGFPRRPGMARKRPLGTPGAPGHEGGGRRRA